MHNGKGTGMWKPLRSHRQLRSIGERAEGKARFGHAPKRLPATDSVQKRSSCRCSCRHQLEFDLEERKFGNAAAQCAHEQGNLPMKNHADQEGGQRPRKRLHEFEAVEPEGAGGDALCAAEPQHTNVACARIAATESKRSVRTSVPPRYLRPDVSASPPTRR